MGFCCSGIILHVCFSQLLIMASKAIAFNGLINCLCNISLRLLTCISELQCVYVTMCFHCMLASVAGGVIILITIIIL